MVNINAVKTFWISLFFFDLDISLYSQKPLKTHKSFNLCELYLVVLPVSEFKNENFSTGENHFLFERLGVGTVICVMGGGLCPCHQLAFTMTK